MHDHEQARLYALRQLNLLDTPPSESFDRITRMASQLFNLPIAAVSLTDKDRQWFKSRVGVEHHEIPRFKACCATVSDSSQVLVVQDLLESSSFSDSYLAESGIRFYAGAPLLTREGYTLGAMCVLGTEPREITEQETAVLKDLAAMVMAQIEMQHAFGRVDSLTGLPNRSQFAEDVEDMARDAPDAQRFALFTDLVDATQSGIVHRVMGPAHLDDLARTAARQLQQALPAGTTLYHIGPCQYIHLWQAGDDTGLLDEALRLRQALMELNPGAVLVRPVVGIAPFRLGDATPEDILRTAHSACLDARQAETGAGIYSTTLDARYHRRFTLLSDFPSALEADDQLRLVYQPRVALSSGTCLGAEALLRWRHPTLGEISPAEFIPLIEHTPQARPLTAWVVRQAIAQAVTWQRQGLALRISINISAVNLEEEDFAIRLLALMERSALPLTAIELELTEGALLGNRRAARQQLDALVAAGIEVAIDDFGTGYSSLAYLQDIPAQVVKIDRSFIHGLEHQPRSQTLVKAMVTLAHDLGYRVVAEGVETQQAYHYLKQLRCDEGQGYLIAKPLSPEGFEAWLAASINA
ncbi:sensor domain-containing phosphodiesterase [Halomonas sp. WWR20]